MKLKNSTDFPDHFLRRMVGWCCKQLDMPVRGVSSVRFTKCRGIYRGRAHWTGNGRGWILVRIGDGLPHKQNHGQYLLNGLPLTDLQTIVNQLSPDDRRTMFHGKQNETVSVAHPQGELTYRRWTELVPIYPYTGRRNSRAPEFTLADRIEALVKVTAHELAHLHLGHRNRSPTCEQNTDGLALSILAKFRNDREALLAAWSDAPQERPQAPKASITDRRAAKAAADLDRWTRKLKLAQTKCRKLRQRVAYYDRRQAACKPTE